MLLYYTSCLNAGSLPPCFLTRFSNCHISSISLLGTTIRRPESHVTLIVGPVALLSMLQTGVPVSEVGYTEVDPCRQQTEDLAHCAGSCAGMNLLEECFFSLSIFSSDRHIWQ